MEFDMDRKWEKKVQNKERKREKTSGRGGENG
jgi:hypothetical protein